MERLKKIVVGVSGGEDRRLTQGSRIAARQALRLAARTGATVDFLHSTFADPEDDTSASAYEGMAGELDSELAGLHAEAGVSDVGEMIVSDERPWIALTRWAQEGKADLVVVAKRNLTGRRSKRLGSVSRRLVQNCPGPVWVMRPEHELEHKCVVAATDLSSVGDLATEFGAYLARADNCELSIVHAWQLPMEAQLAAGRGSSDAEALRAEIPRKAFEHIRGVGAVSELADRAEIFIVQDAPSHAIRRLVDERNPDLVVMGTISRGGVAGMLVGNTAERLLDRLDCSLLTVKPADFVCPLEL